jgi:hypothetical protein
MMSVDRSNGVAPHHLPTAFWAFSAFWLTAGGIASTLSIRAATDSGRVVLLGASLFALAAFGVGLAMSCRTGRAYWFAAGLIVSGLCAPTTFASVLNLVPIATGLALVVWERSAATIRQP